MKNVNQPPTSSCLCSSSVAQRRPRILEKLLLLFRHLRGSKVAMDQESLGLKPHTRPAPASLTEDEALAIDNEAKSRLLDVGRKLMRIVQEAGASDIAEVVRQIQSARLRVHQTFSARLIAWLKRFRAGSQVPRSKGGSA